MSQLLQSLTFWCLDGLKTIMIWTLTCSHQSHPHKWLHFDTNVEHNRWHLCGSSDRTNQEHRYKCSCWHYSAHSVLRWHMAVEIFFKIELLDTCVVKQDGRFLHVQKWNRFILYDNISDWTELALVKIITIISQCSIASLLAPGCLRMSLITATWHIHEYWFIFVTGFTQCSTYHLQHVLQDKINKHWGLNLLNVL